MDEELRKLLQDIADGLHRLADFAERVLETVEEEGAFNAANDEEV